MLRAALENGPIARRSIARVTGLSPASVTGHCADLTRLGLLRELPGEVRSNGAGRPHLPVEIDVSRHLVAAVHVAVGLTTTAPIDLREHTLARRAHEQGIIRAPDLRLLLDAAGAGNHAAVDLLVERARLVGRATVRTVYDVDSVLTTSFPGAVLETAGGAVFLDALYRNPLGLETRINSENRNVDTAARPQ